MPDTSPNEDAIPKRPRRWPGRLLLFLVVLITLGLGLYAFALPNYVETQIVQGMRDLGLPAPAAKVTSVSHDTLHLTEVQTGGLHIPSMRVTYTPTLLRAKQVDKIDIYGATYTVKFTEDGIDLGPLADWAEQQPESDAPMPAARIDLHASILYVQYANTSWPLPITGTITRNESDGKPLVNLTANLPGFEAKVDQSANVKVGDTSDGPIAAFKMQDKSFSLQWQQLPPQVVLDGLASLGITVDRDALENAKALPEFALRGRLQDGVIEIDKLLIAASGINTESLHNISCRIAMTGSYRENTLALQLKADSHFTTKEYGRINLQPIADTPALTWSGSTPQWAMQASTAEPLDLTFGDTKLTGVNITLPVGSQLQTPGEWSVDELVAADLTMSNLAGNIAMRGSELSFKANRFALNDTFGDWSFSGEAQLDGELPLLGSNPPHVKIELFDVNVVNEKVGISAKQVAGAMTINSFNPLASAGSQRVTAKRVQFNQIALDDGIVVFRLESPKSLFIERTEWRFDQEGRFWAHAFRVNSDEISFRMQAFIQDMPLMRWLALLSDKQIVGEGRFSGRIPIDYVAARKNRVHFGEGYLYANPGPGYFAMGEKEMIADLLTDSGIDFAANQQMQALKQNLIEAMQDFEYSQLQLQFIQESSGILTRVHLAGKGRTGQKQEVGGLTLNVRGLEQVINSLLLLKSGSDSGFKGALSDLIEPSKRKTEPKK